MPQVRIVPITELVLDEKNANKGTKRGRQLLGESLGKYGAGRSVVVDRNSRVIAGNKTVEAARAAGMQSITVIETDGASLVAVQRGDLDLRKDKRARELAIADNRVSEIDLEWNAEVLASLDASDGLEDYVLWIDTFVQWTGRRASARLALSGSLALIAKAIPNERQRNWRRQ